MIITCEKCDISFNLDENLLKPTGSKVRCSKCKHIFTAYPPAPEKEPEIQEEVKEAVPSLSSDDDLGLPGLEKMLESDESSKEDFSGEDRFEDETAMIKDEADEQIDISGLEDMLESEEESEGEDLSFESDKPDEAVAATEEELEDLDLDLSLESNEAEEIAAEGKELEDLEIELEDDESEKTLESDLLSTKTVSAVEKDSDDLDIELDIDEEPEVREETLDTTEELIDLEELEQTLEMELLSPGKEDRADEQLDDIELELADDEEMIGEEKDEESLEPASDKDVSDIEQMLEMDNGEEAEAVSDEIELEFDIDAKQDQEEKEGLAPDTTFVDEKEETVVEDQLTEKDVVKAKAKKVDAKKAKPAAKKKKISMPVVVLIVIVLFACAAVGAYFLLESQGVKIPSIKELNIPYISDLFTSGSKKDLGTIETVQSNVRSEFVDNSTLGKLFVISGQVKNTTTKTHHSVKVTAKLYAAGKKLAKSKTVYAGNTLSMEELATSDLNTINQRQANPFSSSGQPIRIKPGETLPFMIIIPNLPENLEEYKVMVSESVPE